MRIVTNSLLHPTNRSISNVNSVFMTSDGPNLSSKIDLIDLGIPYDSHYLSRIVLPAGEENYLLNYGLLKNVTFLLIKVTYNGNYDDGMEDSFDPLYRQEPNTYNINYYFESDSGKTYPIGRLLLLNGSYTNKLERIYLNNPLDYDVVLHVLHANIEPPKTIPTSNDITISNLYYNDIITNQVPCIYNTGITGSTEFLIYAITPAIPSGYTINEYYVPYDTILSISKDLSLSTIYIYTTSITITLKFLTQFDCNQAYSRMMFAYTSYLVDDCRYLTEDNIFQSGSTPLCLVPPTIYYKSPPSGITWIGSGTTIPTNIYMPLVYSGITGWTMDSLKSLFISGITDSNGNNIALSSITFNIYPNGSYVPLTGITEDGIYNIIISVMDISGNNTTNTLENIIVEPEEISPPEEDMIFFGSGFHGIDIIPPIIYYNSPPSGITWVGSGTTVPSNAFLPFVYQGVTGWTLNSLKELFINRIIDCWDDNIPLSSIIFNLYENGSSLPLTGISHGGIYNIMISVTDNADNNTTNYILNITVDDEHPVIVYNYGVITNKINSNSNYYTGLTLDIAPNIQILSGFSLRLKGFDLNQINRVDIIDNIVNRVYDLVDIDINKYMLDVLVVGNSGGTMEYPVITQPGIYCVKLTIKDKSGNEVINPFGTPTLGHYLMMNVVYDEVSDVSIFSEGYWQDDKVWIDTTLWLDYPII